DLPNRPTHHNRNAQLTIPVWAKWYFATPCRSSTRTAIAKSQSALRSQRSARALLPVARCDGQCVVAQGARWQWDGDRALARRVGLVLHRARDGRTACDLSLHTIERDGARE